MVKSHHIMVIATETLDKFEEVWYNKHVFFVFLYLYTMIVRHVVARSNKKIGSVFAYDEAIWIKKCKKNHSDSV